MTRHDYELLSNTLYHEFLELGGNGSQYNMGRADEFRDVVFMLANRLQLDNKAFDKQKFLKDCGVI